MVFPPKKAARYTQTVTDERPERSAPSVSVVRGSEMGCPDGPDEAASVEGGGGRNLPAIRRAAHDSASRVAAICRESVTSNPAPPGAAPASGASISQMDRAL